MCVGHKKNFGAVYKVEEEEGKKKDWAAPRPRITILLKENRKKNILVKKKGKKIKPKLDATRGEAEISRQESGC